MLDFLRRGVKSWVAQILLLLLIISFAVWGIGDVFTASAYSTVARVGDTEVTFEQYARTIHRQQQTLSQQRGQMIPLEMLREAGMAQGALNGLIRDAAFTEELASLDVAVPDEAIAESIRNNQAFQDGQGAFSQYAFQSVLSQQGYDPREFELLTGQLLGQQILIDAVAVGAVEPPGIAEMIAKWQGETRTISTITLTPDAAPDPGEPTDAAVKEYFDANSDAFVEPDRVWGNYLHVDIVAMSQTMTPTDEELRAEYDANIERYTLPATRTVEQIIFKDATAAAEAVERLKSETATYEEIAAEQNVSLDDLSLGVVQEGDLAEAMSDAVFALDQPGIAGPVETLSGHAVFNVTDVQAGGVSPFDDIKIALSQIIANRNARQAAPEQANKIDEVRAAGATMEEIATQTGLELQIFEGIAADGTVAAGEVPALMSDPRFAQEVLTAEETEERDVIQMSDGSYVLVMVDRVEDSHLPELDEIKEKVTEAWKREQRLLAIEAQGAQMATMSDRGTSFGGVASSVGEDASDREPFTRAQAPGDLAPDFVDQIFTVENEGDVVIGRNARNSAVIVAKVNTINALEGEALEQQVAAAQDVLRNAMAGDQLEMFARAIQDKHGSVVNAEAIDQVFEQLAYGHSGQRHGGM
ncbi:MAG: SurA N-terminal domain-containing protein [Pseudomonadota bacterium]